MDRHDGSYFLPYRDFQNQVLPRRKKYPTLDGIREVNFGVIVHERQMKYDPVVKQTHQTRWRLRGYCFWDEERVDCIVTETLP